jgi:hypothetical protein
MALEHYEGNRELVMKAETQKSFEKGIEKVRETMLRFGFSPQAVEQLEFKVSEHMLDISDEERRSGAFHIHGDGKPFYALTLQAPGSLMELGSLGDTSNPKGLSDKQQSLLLAFEIGMNLMGRVNEVLTKVYGLEGDRLAGGVSGVMMSANFETTLRCDPAKYMQALNDLVDMRLKMIVPEPTPQDATTLQRNLKAMKPVTFGQPKP